MRIIIVGCGKVGSALAEQLSAEGHELTLIDLSERRLEELTNRLDLTAVVGSGTSYQVLLEAGVQDTDLVIAVTTHDEINLLALPPSPPRRPAATPSRVCATRSTSRTSALSGMSSVFPWQSTPSFRPRVSFPDSCVSRPPSASARSHAAASSCSTSAFRRSPVWRVWRYARSIPFCAPMCCCAWSAAATRPISPRATSFCTRRRHHGHYPPKEQKFFFDQIGVPQHAHQERHAGRRRQNRLFPRENPA